MNFAGACEGSSAEPSWTSVSEAKPKRMYGDLQGLVPALPPIALLEPPECEEDVEQVS